MDQQSDFPLTDCILVVGGGNGEYILELDRDLEIGQKNLAHSRSLIGGGVINQTLRLLKAGYSPLTILPLGHDLLGQKIHRELLQEYQLSSLGKQVLDYISNDNFLVRDLKLSFISRIGRFLPKKPLDWNISTRTLLIAFRS